jgi:ABC-type glycerol-3-phosphate transport system substrate-binding protein
MRHPANRAALLTVLVAASSLAVAPAALGQDDELSGELTVWDWQYGTQYWGAALKAVDEAFMEAHPGVTITHVAQPNSQYYSLVQAALASQSGPDVLMMHSGTFGVLNYPDSLEPLNDYITPEFRAQIPESGWATAAANFDPESTIYGVPDATSGWVYYYNKDLFRQAGLDPEKPPTTWDEFWASAQTLKDAGIVPFGGGNADQWGAMQELNELLPSTFTVEETEDLALGNVKFTDPAFTEVTQRIADLHAAGFYEPGWASTVNWTDAVTSFGEGKQAIFPGIAADTTSWQEFNAALGEENVGLFYSPDANYLTLSSGPVYSMTNYAKDKDLAWEYIEFLTGVPGATIQWEVGKEMPINTGVTIPDDAPSQVKQMLADAQTNPTYSYVSALMKQATIFEWMKQMQLVLAGTQTVEQALQAVQAVQDQP